MALAIVFAVPLLVSVDWGAPPELEAASYTSASGAWELFVEPSERSGRGKGLHALTEHGREVWRSELPVTLWGAVVADTGVVAGYTYSEGWDGWEAGEGTLQVLVLEPNGDERWRTTIESKDAEYRPVDNPIVSGLVLDEEHDRLIVRIDVDASWWVYRLSDGLKLCELQPKERAATTPDLGLLVTEVHPIGGVPLMLIRFRTFDTSDFSMGYFRRGALFALVDSNAEPVWTLSIPRDYTIENDEQAHMALGLSVEKRGAVLATGERSLSLWHVADRLRVDYRVETTSEGSGWVAREVGRSPYEPPPRVAVTDVELVPLGSVRLRDLEVAPILVERANLEAKVVLQPSTGRRWEYFDDELTLRGADGRIVATHTKRPGDRRWLHIQGCAVAPDGTTAVLCEGFDYFTREREPGLALFSPDGAPLRTVPLQEDTVSTVAFSGRWAALHRWGADVYLIDLEDDSIQRFEFKGDVSKRWWHPSFSPDGRELWMVDRGAGEVQRFVLPQ